MYQFQLLSTFKHDEVSSLGNSQDHLDCFSVERDEQKGMSVASLDSHL